MGHPNFVCCIKKIVAKYIITLWVLYKNRKSLSDS
jgi:hypothetical protein